MKNDLEQYNKQGSTWWNPNGPFYVLKSMNEPRFNFFEDLFHRGGISMYSI